MDQPQYQQESQSQPETSLPSSSPAGEISSEHIDAIIAGTVETPVGATAPAAPVMLNEAAFHKMFIAGFKMGHSLTGLQSLKVNGESAEALDCSKALYESIIDIPALHFLLQPHNKWAERAFAIGAFTIPVAIGVRIELQARKSQPVKPQPLYRQQPSGAIDLEGLTAEQAAALGAVG